MKFSVLFFVVSTLTASAALADYTIRMNCSSVAEAMDAGQANIVAADDGQLYVQSESMRTHQASYKALKLAHAGTGITQYVGQNVTLSISERGDGSGTLAFSTPGLSSDYDLTYQCKPAQQN